MGNSRDNLSANERALRLYIDELALPKQLHDALLEKLNVCLNEIGTDFGHFVGLVCCEGCLNKLRMALEDQPMQDPS